MTKKEIDVKWEDFSLFDKIKTSPKIYNSVLVIDLKGKKIQFDGKFSLSTEGDKIVAKAERTP
tara:strand:- start:4763 stop:4951 length:189 start_codon:yes stop_codon:yes gene_type:complete